MHLELSERVDVNNSDVEARDVFISLTVVTLRTISCMKASRGAP